MHGRDGFLHHVVRKQGRWQRHTFVFELLFGGGLDQCPHVGDPGRFPQMIRFIDNGQIFMHPKRGAGLSVAGVHNVQQFGSVQGSVSTNRFVFLIQIMGGVTARDRHQHVEGIRGTRQKQHHDGFVRSATRGNDFGVRAQCVGKHVQSCGVKLVASSEQAKDNIYQTDLTGPIAIIMGDEGEGVQPKTLEKVNHVAKIPMGGKVASLNVAVAAGMILSEIERQHNYK